MDQLLSQALMLTLVGMGMTFLAIGALVAGMYLMTALIKDRRSARAVTMTEPPEAAETQEQAVDERAMRAKAAAAAVGVALARTEVAAAAAVGVALAQASAGTPAPSQPRPEAIGGSWDAYARRQRLSQRARYDARRFR